MTAHFWKRLLYFCKRRPAPASPDSQEQSAPLSLQVRDAMIPRMDIVGVPEEASFAELCAIFKAHNVSALPVFHKNLDHVVSVVHARDILGLSTAKQANWRKYSTPALFASPSMSVTEAAATLYQSKKPLLLVVDEYGGLDGLVTPTDLLNALFEELGSPLSQDQTTFSKSGFSFFEGRISLERFQALFPAHPIILEESLEDDITTLGGLVCHLAGEVPAKGEIITHTSGLTFKVIDSDPRKINQLAVSITPPLNSGNTDSAQNAVPYK